MGLLYFLKYFKHTKGHCIALHSKRKRKVKVIEKFASGQLLLHANSKVKRTLQTESLATRLTHKALLSTIIYPQGHRLDSGL